MSNLSIVKNADDNQIQIISDNEKQICDTLTITDEKVKGVYQATKDFILSLSDNEGKINSTNSIILSTLVKELVEFANGYKSLKGGKKKDLVIILIKEIFEVEVTKMNINEELRSVINLSINNYIEPSIDLAIYVAKGGIKIDTKKTKRTFSKLIPCLSFK